jgi:hypothetical protein
MAASGGGASSLQVTGPAMPDETEIDRKFIANANRLIKREQLLRAAADLNSTSPPALESALANISAEVTEEAAERLALEKAKTAPHPSKPES